MLGRFIKDKHGNVVIWQRPSLPLWVWLASMLLIKILPNGQLNSVAELISFVSLFTWAWLEITQGASPFRRTLGAVVISYMVLSGVTR